MSLDDTDRAMLDFEREWAVDRAGDKDSEIRQRFAMTNVDYYMALAGLIIDEAAMEYDEVTVRRLRRDSVRDRNPPDGLADVVQMRPRQ